MAVQHVVDGDAQKLLTILPHGLNERSDQTHITPSMSAHRVDRRLMQRLRRLLRQLGRALVATHDINPRELGRRELTHVTDELAIGEVDPRLALADLLGERDHSERNGLSAGELDIDDLMIHNVVRTLVDALAISAVLKCVTNVLDVRDTVDDGRCRPADAPS